MTDRRPGASDACDHGGAFFTAIGDAFDDLSRRARIINADVLDAWFDPAPAVLRALTDHLPWLLATSPPTHAEGLIRAISNARAVPAESVVVGAGSSALIFLALRRWLTPASRALILSPMYAEYAHVLEHLIGCRVDRLTLNPDDDFRLDPADLRTALARGYDFVALVNPNNPSGHHLPRPILLDALRAAPPYTRLWIDEAYVDYAGPDQSLERDAARSNNLIVCKSLSKAYALSGARAAYLVAPPAIAADLRALTPPWAVSLPAQVAAVAALGASRYYAAQHAQTHRLRARLADGLRALDAGRIVEGVINSVLWLLDASAPAAHDLVESCRARGLFLRDCATIDPRFGPRAVRIAVKDEPTLARMLDIIAAALAPTPAAR